MLLVQIEVTVAEFYLVPRLDKTQSSLSTEVSCFDNISLPSCQWVVLKSHRKKG